MDRPKTSEGFSHYMRYTRARDVDNRKGLQRSSDGLPWRCPGLRCCAVAGERRAAPKNASVARSGRFPPIPNRIGRVRSTRLIWDGKQLPLFCGRVKACSGMWRLISESRVQSTAVSLSLVGLKQRWEAA
jgi:hypothetical protein